MPLPSFYEPLARHFAHGRGIEFGKDGEDNRILERQAKIRQVLHGTFDADGVGLDCGVVTVFVEELVQGGGIVGRFRKDRGRGGLKVAIF